ncbi:MAG TPA: c-type cytochrome, partial [Cytophagales bacterium]
MKRSNAFFFAALWGVLALLAACNGGSSKPAKRPYEAWVLRSVLDQKPRMLSMALHDSLWAAYNTKTGTLYKVWRGKVNFDGPVYTTAHGPQPTSEGVPLMMEPDSAAWRIVASGTETTPEINYRGHAIRNNQVTLRYELLHNGQPITVTETPEYFAGKDGKVGFQRVFTTENVPSGAQVALRMHPASLLSEEDYRTDGTFTAQHKGIDDLEGKKYLNLAGTLTLKSNGKTEFAAEFTPQPAKALAAKEQLRGEEAVQALFAKSDCNTCHNKDVRTVGPAYKAIAEKYDNTSQRTEELVAKVIKGGAGNWGSVPMTPHPDLPKADATTMVSYILALDGEKPGAVKEHPLMPKPAFAIDFQKADPAAIDPNAEKPGIAVNIYKFSEAVPQFPEINGEMMPVAAGVVNALHANEGDLGDMENFALHASGFINLDKTTNVVFRIVADDG